MGHVMSSFVKVTCPFGIQRIYVDLYQLLPVEASNIQSNTRPYRKNPRNQEKTKWIAKETLRKSLSRRPLQVPSLL